MASNEHALSAGILSGSRLSVGIDPHASILDSWGLADDAGSAEIFGRKIVDAAAGSALCVKPQIAFFERFGAKGYVALERIFSHARDAGLPIIADVKRGDIGSTFEAYAKSWLEPGSALEADAMTVVPYQGFETLNAAFDIAESHNKVVFVLAATSNPEARGVQTAVLEGSNTSVAAGVVSQARSRNLPLGRAVGNTGVVIGATVSLEDYGIEPSGTGADPLLPILAPGFGHQGARLEDAARTFRGMTPGLIVHESRSLLNNGANGLDALISNRAQEIGELLS